MDDKGEKCIFTGYNTKSKAFKLYNPETMAVIINRDVTFDEKGMWDWSSKSQQEQMVIVDNNEENDEWLLDPTPDKPKSSRRLWRNP